MASVKKAIVNDEEVEVMDEMPTAEEILMNEDDLIAGLLKAADYKEDESLQKKIQIKRNGVLLFEFRIHPMDEEEIQRIRKKCTKYAPNPNGRNLPRIEVETNYVKLRSMKIYEATVAEDQQKVWNNEKIKRKLNVLDPLEVIELVLMAGEKDAIVDQIDAISGYGMSAVDFAGE